MSPTHRGEPRGFVREAEGDGRAADLAAKTLAELRRGHPPTEWDVDLHGLTAREAERLVGRELARARAEGVRCVRVIHGRGLHSEDGAVLRDRLPGWLTSGPLASAVLAFARRDRGGSTAVLLRRAGRR